MIQSFNPRFLRDSQPFKASIQISYEILQDSRWLKASIQDSFDVLEQFSMIQSLNPISSKLLNDVQGVDQHREKKKRLTRLHPNQSKAELKKKKLN